MSDAPSQNQDKFIVRLPDGMRERIRFAAERNNRSMNSEIVATLEEKYPRITPHPNSFLEAKIADKMAKVGWSVSSTRASSAIDLIVERDGVRIGIEVKSRAEKVTPEIVRRIAQEYVSSQLDELWLFATGEYSIATKMTAADSGIHLFDTSSEEWLDEDYPTRT